MEDPGLEINESVKCFVPARPPRKDEHFSIRRVIIKDQHLLLLCTGSSSRIFIPPSLWCRLCKMVDDQYSKVKDDLIIKDATEDECIQDVLEQKEREEEQEEMNSHDVFESGVIWTQTNQTQIQRNAFLRTNGNCSLEDDQFKPINIDGRKSSRENHLGGEEDDDGFFIHQIPSSSIIQQKDTVEEELEPSQEDGDPWWKKGKTAPLLDDYDDRRRMWYMAQAGVYDESESVHDAQARLPILVQAPVVQAQESPRQVHRQRDTSSSPPIIVEQTPNRLRPTSGTLSSSSSNNIHHTTSSPNPITHSFFQRRTTTSTLPSGSSTTSITPQRAALSLAGNLNTPISQKGTPILQTPKRKTWQSTLALREQATPSLTDLPLTGNKRRRGGGSGRGGGNLSNPRHARGRGRGGASPSTPNRTVLQQIRSAKD